jgi:SAM-dependent methyltransferase
VRDPLGRLLTRWRVAVVLPHVRGRLLDIGCGTNQLVRSYGGEGVGVDVHPWEGVDLVVEDTAHLPFEDARFDTVTIVAALNHIPDRDAVLREAHRVLKPGGSIVTTMIPPTISRVWHMLRSPWDDDQHERGMKEGEVYGLTPKDIDELLRAAQFQPRLEQRFMLGINRLRMAERPP